MLTGLLNPSSGRAEVFGIDIFEDIEKVREFLGVCP
jgi:ABC-type multidrug transport system ATPase subunit